MPKKKTPVFYVRRFADDKKEEARRLPGDAVGLFLKLENAVRVVLRAPGIIQIQKEIDKDVGLFVFGVTSSKTEARSFEGEFRALEEGFRNRLSTRDMNFIVVEDFICRFIQENLYESHSEKPMPFEFIVVQVEPAGLHFCLIDYEGNFRTFAVPTRDFDIIGCTDARKRRKIEAALEKARLNKISPKNMDKLIVSVTQPYKGERIVAAFDFVNKKDK